MLSSPEESLYTQLPYILQKEELEKDCQEYEEEEEGEVDLEGELINTLDEI